MWYDGFAVMELGRKMLIHASGEQLLNPIHASVALI